MLSLPSGAELRSNLRASPFGSSSPSFTNAPSGLLVTARLGRRTVFVHTQSQLAGLEVYPNERSLAANSPKFGLGGPGINRSLG